MTTVFTTNNNNIDAGSGNIICGPIQSGCVTPYKSYNFTTVDSSNNYFNSITNSYDLNYVNGSGSSSTIYPMGEVLKQNSTAKLGNTSASYYYSSISFNSTNGFEISLNVNIPLSTTDGDKSRIPFVIANNNDIISPPTELFALSLTRASNTNLIVKVMFVNNNSVINMNIQYGEKHINSGSNLITVIVKCSNADTSVQTYINNQIVTSIFGSGKANFNYNNGTNNKFYFIDNTIFIPYKLFTGNNYTLYLGGVPPIINPTSETYLHFNGDIDDVSVKSLLENGSINAENGLLTCGSVICNAITYSNPILLFQPNQVGYRLAGSNFAATNVSTTPYYAILPSAVNVGGNMTLNTNETPLCTLNVGVYLFTMDMQVNNYGENPCSCSALFYLQKKVNTLIEDILIRGDNAGYTGSLNENTGTTFNRVCTFSIYNDSTSIYFKFQFNKGNTNSVLGFDLSITKIA